MIDDPIPESLKTKTTQALDYLLSPVDDGVDQLVEDYSRRYLVDRWYTVLVAALVVVAVSAGYVAVGAHGQPSTVTEQEVASEWTVSTSFDHSADVERTGVLYREGERLENQPLYFTNLSSSVDVVHMVQHGGDDVEPADVDVELTKHLRSVDGDGDVYWSDSELVASESYTSVENAGVVETEASIDVDDAADRIQRIQRDIGASPGSAEVALEFDVTVDAEAAGEPVEVERTDVARLTPTGSTFSVNTESGEETERVLTDVEHRVSRSPLSLYLSPVAALAAVVALFGVVRGRRRGAFELPSDVRRRLEFERQRDDLDDWISRASVPEGGTRIELDSLEDLVDVAIDSDRRVLETGGEGGREFVVVVDGMRYYYEPEFQA